MRLALGLAHLRRKALLQPPSRRKLRRPQIKPDDEPRQTGGAERRRLQHGRPIDRRGDDVGQKLHRVIVSRHAAVDAQRRRPVEGSIQAHRLENIARLEAQALQRGARDFVGARAARQVVDRAAAFAVPTGRSNPTKAGARTTFWAGSAAAPPVPSIVRRWR